MGKTKQIKTKKFDRSVEISAPILDAETIRAIHSPPKDKKLDIRHGGFKALLSDLNSQDSTDEVTPITEGYQPSYIGISCAVSGYSNYSSYSRRMREGDANGIEARENNARLLTTPNRSNTATPLAKRLAEQHQQNIHHVTIDKSSISSPDQERKELTDKLTASVVERQRRSPSPLPPLEDGRHHGAYVGARYFPMPEPSKIVHKHIPLLGIDDDQDPDQVVVEDTNKVEKRIANLYGEDFVEDWKESMSHKSKKELHEEAQQNEKTESKKPKDLVNLKHVPAQSPPPAPEPVDVPTPDVKVLHGVEKQFLNRLLTDENPPMPKSPSPQPTSPVSPRYSRPVVLAEAVTNIHTSTQESNIRESIDSPPPKGVSSPQRKPTPPPVSLLAQRPISPQHQAPSPAQPSPTMSPVASPSPTVESTDEIISTHQRTDSPVVSSASDSRKASPAPSSPRGSPIPHREPEAHINLPESIPEEVDEVKDEIKDEIITLDDQLNATLGGHISPMSREDVLPPSPSSPDSVREIHADNENVGQEPTSDLIDHHEDHIEYKIRTQSPVDNESSPVHIIEGLGETTNIGQPIQESANLVSFSPELTEKIESSEHNNNDDLPTATDQLIDLTKTDLLQPELMGVTVETSSAPLVGSVVDAIGSVPESKTGDAIIKDGRYFLTTLENEESFIADQVKLAEARLAEHEADWDEETIGKVRSAIGKANLLTNKKCNQFRELCEKSLVNDASDQYAVLNDDLAGFWDMISIQIADVKKSFENL